MTQTMAVVPVNTVPSTSSTTAGPAPIIQYEVGGRTYTAKRHSLCHMCVATHVDTIETNLMMGYATRTIWETLPEDCDLKASEADGGRGWDYRQFSRALMRHRQNGHMPFEAITARIQQEQRAVKMGLDLEEVRGSIVDHLTGLDAIIQKGFEQVQNGAPIKPSVLVSAIRTRAAISQAQAGTIDNDVVFEAFSRYLEVTRGWAADYGLGEDAFRALGALLAADPGLRALADQVQRQREAADIDPRSTAIGSVADDDPK